jgi:hypothetical protein
MDYISSMDYILSMDYIISMAFSCASSYEVPITLGLGAHTGTEGTTPKFVVCPLLCDLPS